MWASVCTVVISSLIQVGDSEIDGFSISMTFEPIRAAGLFTALQLSCVNHQGDFVCSVVFHTIPFSSLPQNPALPIFKSLTISSPI